MRFTRRLKRVLIGFGFLSLLVLFVVLGMYRYSEAQKERRRYEIEKAALVPPTPQIVSAELLEMKQTRRFAALLEPWQQANVAAEVGGRVTELRIDTGSVVRGGESLVKLEESIARIQVERAQAQVLESQRLLEEAKRLLTGNTIAESEYQARLAAMTLDAANLAEAEETLRRHTIRAPFDGRVVERLVDVGDVVNTNETVCRLADLSVLRATFAIAEQDLPGFLPGQPLRVEIPAFPNVTVNAKVDFLSPSADPRTLLYRVESLIPNEANLPGGLRAVIYAERVAYEGAPFLPAAAVQFVGRRSVVWRMDEAKGDDPSSAQMIEVRVGEEIDGFYPILDGLSVGDRVLIR